MNLVERLRVPLNQNEMFLKAAAGHFQGDFRLQTGQRDHRKQEIEKIYLQAETGTQTLVPVAAGNLALIVHAGQVKQLQAADRVALRAEINPSQGVFSV